MMVVTGLVVAVGIGIVAETMNGDMPGTDTVAGQVVDDRFVVRAGARAELDVLANDVVSPDIDIRITTGPDCGQVKPMDGAVLFNGSETCDGPVSFAYCAGAIEGCTPATVFLTVHGTGIAARDAAPLITSQSVDLGVRTHGPVAGANPEFALIPADSVEDAGLRAFAATIGAPQPAASVSTVARYAGAMAGLDGLAAAHRGLVPLAVSAPDPLRAAGYLRSYADGDMLSDPARRYSVEVFSGIELAALDAGEDFNARLPAQRVIPSQDVAIDDSGDARAIEAVAARFEDGESTGTCDVAADLTPAPGAHVTLSLAAPCLAGTDIVAESHGFEFLLPVSEEGTLSVDLPALALEAVVTLRGDELAAPVRLAADGSEVLQVERTVVRLDGDAGLTLAALEFGAALETRVDVAEALSHREAFLAGRGYVRRYAGADGAVIEVYTLPLSRQVKTGLVAFQLVPTGNSLPCGGPVALDFLTFGKLAGEVQRAELPMSLCANGAAIPLGDVVGNIAVAAQ